jgi:hypothetical protein
MGIVARLLGAERQDDERGISRLQAATRERSRRELISTAVWDTLKKHGLPAGCVTVDALPGFTPTRHRGVHIQLIFRDWEPSRSSYVVALEAAVKSRLGRLDPLSPSWITGMSWRFEPEDRTVWPRLPTPDRSSATTNAVRILGCPPPAAELRKLPQSGDVAFTFTARAQNASATDFSPTLPMTDNESAPAEQATGIRPAAGPVRPQPRSHLDQPLASRIHRQAREIAQAEPLHDPGAMHVHRLGAEA